jgi:hypothetical protein
MGSMILSTRYCLILACAASIVSLLAIGTIHVFDHYSPSRDEEWDWVSELGDWIVCVLWVGGSMAGLAWSKLWVGNPNFNTGELRMTMRLTKGCSMAAVTVFSVVIKEGGLKKLGEVLLIVVIGGKFLVYDTDFSRHHQPGLLHRRPHVRHIPSTEFDINISDILFHSTRSSDFYFPSREGCDQGEQDQSAASSRITCSSF